MRVVVSYIKLSTARPSPARFCPNTNSNHQPPRKISPTTHNNTMFLIPPFKPRPPMPISPGMLRPLRQYQIFPNLVRLPTTNATCARLRLSRKHITVTKRQTELLTLLQNQLETVSRQLSSLQAVHHAQLRYLQTQTPPTTVQNDYLNNLPCFSSVLSKAQTMFLSSPSTLFHSYPLLPSSLPLSPEPP